MSYERVSFLSVMLMYVESGPGGCDRGGCITSFMLKSVGWGENLSYY